MSHDFHILTLPICEQNLRKRLQIGPYTVTFHRDLRTGHKELHCTCKGFQFRQKCKHIDQLEAERCHWGKGAFVGDLTEAAADGTCPSCGGPVTHIQVAV